MELFDVIPENFFSILSSKNKRLYSQCAIEAFNIYEQGSIYGIERKIVADELVLFLEKNEHLYQNDEDEFKDSLEEPSNLREIVNLVLRRLEQCGWIYIDVTSDYIEYLNFTDTAITMVEAMINMCPFSPVYQDDSYEEEYYQPIFNPNEYQGYIYTIYSLLNNSSENYGIVISEVFKNTKLLIRSLRKIDSRMKDYINSVVETSEIKDLMERLINYNQELFESSYQKLKTSDNVNKYRLDIVTKLEEISMNQYAMDKITKDYLVRFRNTDIALSRANKDIDEMVDVFNSLDEFISGIDLKNKTYINSTIGKIKFLLTEEDNIIGKLNTILKYVKNMNSKGKVDKAINEIKDVVVLNSTKCYSDYSLYSPRGKYSRGEFQQLDLDRFDIDGIDESIIRGYRSKYDPIFMEDFILRRLNEDNSLEAKTLITYDSPDDDVMLLVYILIFASEHQYKILKLNDKIEHQKFSMSNFTITKEE